GPGAITRRIYQEPAHGGNLLCPDAFSALGSATRHGSRPGGARQLQKGVQRARRPGEKAPGQASQRLRMEAQPAARAPRSADVTGGRRLALGCSYMLCAFISRARYSACRSASATIVSV